MELISFVKISNRQFLGSIRVNKNDDFVDMEEFEIILSFLTFFGI